MAQPILTDDDIDDLEAVLNYALVQIGDSDIRVLDFRHGDYDGRSIEEQETTVKSLLAKIVRSR